jgi:RES domain-containing protein
MKVWRLAKAAYTTPNGEGAKKYGGRWNPSGLAVVYTSESLALAAFEALVHADSDLLPDNLVILSAEIPDTLSIRTITPKELPAHWQAIPAPRALQAIGTEWIRAEKGVGLRVPSSVISQEWNLLLNPAHPDFSKIKWTNDGPFNWDKRLEQDKKKS